MNHDLQAASIYDAARDQALAEIVPADDLARERDRQARYAEKGYHADLGVVVHGMDGLPADAVRFDRSIKRDRLAPGERFLARDVSGRIKDLSGKPVLRQDKNRARDIADRAKNRHAAEVDSMRAARAALAATIDGFQRLKSKAQKDAARARCVAICEGTLGLTRAAARAHIAGLVAASKTR